MSNHTGSYREDLAFIHDDGFADVARSAAQELFRLLKRSKDRQPKGRIVDLGCGSGVLAELASNAGYDVVGFDWSKAMLALAKKRAPRAVFRCESFVTAALPPCEAVTAIGEVFNYLFDGRNRSNCLSGVFDKIYEALQPGGLLLFDVAGPGRIPAPGHVKGFREGDRWACLYSGEENRKTQILTRTITTFRKVGRDYRRDCEIHRLRLYRRSEVSRLLRSAGFRARGLSHYSEFRFPPGWFGFAARKPT